MELLKLMGFEQWLAQWKPGDLSITALVVVFAVFFILRVWPWLTKEYWPAQQKFREKEFDASQHREEVNQKVIQDISETLSELKVLVAQNIAMTNTVLEYLVPPKAVRTRKAVNDATQPKKPKAKVAA